MFRSVQEMATVQSSTDNMQTQPSCGGGPRLDIVYIYLLVVKACIILHIQASSGSGTHEG